MDYWQAVLLGVVQGLTEFLPVSSSGHLVVFQQWLEYDASDPALMLFDLVVHLGTVIAVLFYFRLSLRRYLATVLSARSWQEPMVRVTLLAILSTSVTGAAYVLFGHKIEESFGSAFAVAIGWLITGSVLMITAWRGKPHGSLKDLTWRAAILIGLAQGVALLPGVSRSGSTICVALLLGMRRQWASQYSFLIGVPAICGATVIKGIKYLNEDHVMIGFGPMAVGFVVSAVVGLGALSLLVWMLRTGKLQVFAVYCYALAVFTLWR